MLKFAHKTKMW